MRALVVGQGSIGSRHARLLAEMGCHVAVVTRRAATTGTQVRTWSDLGAALDAERFDYIVIANRTSEHYDALRTLAQRGFTGAVLVEKPLFDRPRALPAHQVRRLAVAYNLRFHPVLVALRRRLANRKVLAVEAYAGQWLPDWRPGTDYRASYSAKAAEGGGVLRDLSHELDLIGWLFGPWLRLAALGGRRSSLEIDADDVWTIMIELECGAALTLQLNYLDRPGRRRLVVNTDASTLVAEVGAGTLTENGEATRFEVARDDTYRAEHAAMLHGGPGEPCTAPEGLEVLSTIDAVERAAAGRCFVERRAAA